MLGVIGLLSVVLVVVRSGWVAYDITEVGFNLLQIGKSGSLGGCMGKDVGSGDELGQNHDVLGQNRGDDFDKRKKDVSGEGGYSRRRRSSTISRASSNSSFRSKRSRETFNVPQSRFGIVNGDSYEYL